MFACVVADFISFLVIEIDNGYVFILSYFIISLVNNLFSPISKSVLNNNIDQEIRTTLLSVLSFAISFVMILTFPLLGVLSESFNVTYSIAFMGTIVMAIVFMGVAAFFKRVAEMK